MLALVTRPRPEAEDTAALLRDAGLDALIAPMMTIVPRPVPANETEIPGEDIQAVLLTSANGARGLMQRPLGAWIMERDVMVIAVGDATAATARAAGCSHVVSADGDAAKLAHLARSRLDPSRGALLHARGVNTAGDLATELSRAGFRVRELIVYDAVAADHLPTETVTALRGRTLDLVLFFSPRTAGIFTDLVTEFGLDDRLDGTRAVCISHAVAGRAEAIRWQAVDIAAEPTEDALLNCVRKYVVAQANT